MKNKDSLSILKTAGLLPEQMEQAWEEVNQLELPPQLFRGISNVVVAGMGGSALGATIIDALGFELLKVPLEVIKGYRLPAYVNHNSLVVVSSYSGDTQETLKCYQEAVAKDGRVLVISTNGQLATWAKKDQQPAYLFKPSYNPSGQSRMGLGYSIVAQLAFLARGGLISVNEAQIKEVVNYLKNWRPQLLDQTKKKKNPAQQLAQKFKNRVVILVSSEHLIGATQAFKNLINENSKTLSFRFSLPEMNHHLLEGLAFPRINQKTFKLLFLNSGLYAPEIQKRFKITQTVVKQNRIPLASFDLKGKTRLIQVFETIYLAGYFSVYLAFLNRVDPGPIPWVDYFKKQLAAAHDQ